MNLPAIPQNKQTMSSLEIAELTGKNHRDVMRDIRNILKEVGLDERKFARIYLDSMNREQTCFDLPKKETLLITSGYSALQRLKILDRLEEYESYKKLPQTFSEALRLAAEQAEQIERLEVKVATDAPKVQFAEAVRNMEGGCPLGEFCKTLTPTIGRNNFFDWLRSIGVLMVGSRLPYQKYRDAGYFTVVEQNPYKDNKGKAHPTFTTFITGVGQVWIENKYRKSQG